MGLNSISNGLANTSTTNKLLIGAGAVGAAGLTGLGVASIVKRNKRRKSKRGKNRHIRKRANRNKKMRRRKTPYTAGKRKDTSHKRIRYTKKGQPYVIMGNGRARFIKKKGAARSHKLKGGRY